MTSSRVLRFDDIGDVVKFAAVAAALAMVADAVIGHGLLWQNDPYWTYWVTDTLLMTTVFGVGTAFLGAGVARGALLAAVQTLVLTTYYWSLSPIGLPGSPEWLDLQHTWVTGPPVHFGVYFLGYLVALWMWRRRAAGEPARTTAARTERGLGASAAAALVTVVGLVAVLGAAQTLAVGEFPGVTWLVMRTAVLVPFTLGWWGFVGHDRGASVAGGAVAAVVLAAYGHYLGPIGVPATDLRIVAQDPPPADFHWLSYTDEFLVMGPITVAVAVAVFLAASRWHGHRWTAIGLPGVTVVSGIAAVVVLVVAGLVTAAAVGRDDRTVTVSSAGDARVVSGPSDDPRFVEAEAAVRLRATQGNTKRTPLPPRDDVALEATVSHPDGTRYELTATSPMVDEPAGRFTTWGGVGFDRWHHGRSGIGTFEPGPTRSEVAVYALGELRADGAVVASDVHVHAMTVDGAGMELRIGSDTAPVAALPGGDLRVIWQEGDGHSPEDPERARHLLGGLVLLFAIGAALAANRSIAADGSEGG